MINADHKLFKSLFLDIGLYSSVHYVCLSDINITRYDKAPNLSIYEANYEKTNNVDST